MFDSLPEATEKEDDMLDQAFGLTASSRLSCQIRLTSKCNNMLVKLPSATRNFYVVRCDTLVYVCVYYTFIYFFPGRSCSEAPLILMERGFD